MSAMKSAQLRGKLSAVGAPCFEQPGGSCKVQRWRPTLTPSQPTQTSSATEGEPLCPSG